MKLVGCLGDVDLWGFLDLLGTDGTGYQDVKEESVFDVGDWV